ncbi:MAG: hypothetical protein Tsb0034_05500 [Ekhidna sp.]
MQTKLESLLEKSNQIKHHVSSSIATLPKEQLSWKENTKKWSVLEVLKHLSLVYDKYLENFSKAISSAPVLSSDQTRKTERTLLGRLSIYSMKPKGKRRKFKMKTFDFFTPAHQPDHSDEIINEFLDKKGKFNELIREARMKDLHGVKMPTALGEKMKFYVPECFEFILAHEERHMIQIEEILQQQ